MTSASDEKWRPFKYFFQSGWSKDLSAPLWKLWYQNRDVEAFLRRSWNGWKDIIKKICYVAGLWSCQWNEVGGNWALLLVVLTTVNSPFQEKKKKNSKLQATHIVVGPDTFSTVQIKSQSPPTPAHSPQLDITIMVPLNHSMIPCRSTCGCRKQPLSSQVSCAYKRIDTSLPIKFLATPKCQYNKHLNWAPQYTWQKE